MKNTPTDNIILHMCTKNNAHMMYDSEIRSVTDGETDEKNSHCIVS